jgi:4-hydroxy-tetrahydrodipicolinate synthase
MGKIYREIKQRLRGSIAPVVTPFKANYEIDFESQSKLIEFQIENGSHGISVTGTSGEPSSLTTEERIQVMENAYKTINGRVPFVPATGSTNHQETMHLTKVAQDIGADAAMVIVPYYNKPNQQALYNHFKTVADSVDIPIIVYNIPGRTGVNLEVKTLARLVEDCPNIIGAKESNKDFEHVNRVLLNCGRDFNIYSGIELLCYPMLAIGGAGSISATANVEPAKVAEMHDAYDKGNIKRALDLHYELMNLNDVLFKDTNPGPVKYALGLMGMIEPVLRMPMGLPLPELQEEIRQTLIKYGKLPQEVK